VINQESLTDVVTSCPTPFIRQSITKLFSAQTFIEPDWPGSNRNQQNMVKCQENWSKNKISKSAT